MPSRSFQSTHPRRVRRIPSAALPVSFRVFQSTHPRRVRLGVQVAYLVAVAVSIHAPAKGATPSSGGRCPSSSFQSTHPRRVRLLRMARPPLADVVSIHAPAKGATEPSHAPRRVVRVSIHAPAKGATRQRRPSCARVQVSIHAPAKGATSRARRTRTSRPGFNPRTREGCDAWLAMDGMSGFLFQSTHPRRVRPLHGVSLRLPRGVSIHAPAKGATMFGSIAITHRLSFNPRTREGCDRRATGRRSWWTDRFNPRTREGCDRERRSPPRRRSCFNPRTREGCDSLQAAGNAVKSQFQSTHPRRVRREIQDVSSELDEFQSTHPRRVRHGAKLQTSETDEFQSTHPRRVRRPFPLGGLMADEFQSTHPRRVRHHPRRLRGFRSRVSIHAPAKGATMIENTYTTTTEFQSTHPRRVRHEPARNLRGIRAVSIHAPAKGATMRLSSPRPSLQCFNPRTREGCDSRSPARPPTSTTSFNPRTREGCDPTGLLGHGAARVSIHAPAKGAT